VVSAKRGGLDGVVNRAVVGHQHDGQARLRFVKLLYEFKTAESGPAQVGQHHIEFVFVGAAQPLVAAIAHGNFEAVLCKHVAQVRGQTYVIFDKKNMSDVGHEQDYCYGPSPVRSSTETINRSRGRKFRTETKGA